MRISDVLKAQAYGLQMLDKDTLERLEPLLEATLNRLKRNLNSQSTDNFNVKKQKQILAYIDYALLETRGLLERDMKRAAEIYNSYGYIQANKEIQSMTGFYPSINRTVVSLDKNTYIFNRMQASLDTYSANIRATIMRALQQAILQNVSGHKVTVSLQKFMDVKKWRAQRLVRTEMHNIFNASKILSYSEVKKEYLPDLKKALWHPMDERTADDSLKLRKIHPVVSIEQPFVFKWKGEKRVFMNPPDRPNDRAVLVPYREKWENKYKE